MSALSEEYDALVSEWDAVEELPPEIEARFAEIDAALEAFGNGTAFDPDEIARGGLFVILGQDGVARVERGLIRPEDVPVPEPEAQPEDEEAGAESREEGASVEVDEEDAGAPFVGASGDGPYGPSDLGPSRCLGGKPSGRADGGGSQLGAVRLLDAVEAKRARIVDMRLGPFPAFLIPHVFGDPGQLLGGQPVQQGRVFEPAAAVLGEEVAQDGPARLAWPAGRAPSGGPRQWSPDKSRSPHRPRPSPAPQPVPGGRSSPRCWRPGFRCRPRHGGCAARCAATSSAC